MAKKVYAIKEGFNFTTNERVENIIVDTWAECLKYVKGVKGAKYKSFESMHEAKQFLEEGSKMLKKGIDKYPEDCLHIYVDGSYNLSTKKYSYGLVAVRNNIVEYIDSGASTDTSQSNIRQIAGELEAATRGIEYALSKKDSKVVIFHDYEGIAHHATGFWERREESSIRYYNKMNNLMSQGIEVIFVKVDSHTGELFNELADEKCKEALGINSNKIVDKWLEKNKLYVSNNKVKEEILVITEGKTEQIIVANSIDNVDTELKSDKKNNNAKIINSEDVKREINIVINELSLDKQLEVLKYIRYISKNK
jgi:ribonuclease HI